MTEAPHPAMLEERVRELENETTRLAKSEAIYKDAFKDATMANTAAAQNLARQEAKTVEYRAAWIKATRERDEYAKRVRAVRKLYDEVVDGDNEYIHTRYVQYALEGGDR